MASVWLAHDDRLGRLVAVKVVADTLADDPDWLARFKREARAAAAMSHPNIVGVFDYGIENGRPYLVMEHVAGANLSEHLADPATAPLDPEPFARELLDAVAHVHGAGIVHRDIKPANILLDAQARAHLTDFGIALSRDSTSLTQTGVVIGTARYLAPEVAAGAPADEASDLYSAGMVISEVAGPAPAVAALVTALTQNDRRDRVLSATAALELLRTPSPPTTGTTPTRVMAAPRAATASTRAQPVPAYARTDRATPATRSRVVVWLHARSVRSLLAAGALAAIVIIIVVVSLDGGGRSSDQPRQPRTSPVAAPADAPLADQLRALDRIVDDAARR